MNKNNENKSKITDKQIGYNIESYRRSNIKEEIKIKRFSENDKENNLQEKKCKIEIIKVGESKNGRVYTEESISKIPSLLIEGKKKMFIDHTNGFENRSLKDWVATIINVWYDKKEKTVFANIKVHSNWLWQRIIETPEEVGVSIDAIGILSEENNTIYVKDILDINSVDFVTAAAAGGGIYASLIKECVQKTIIKENVNESEREKFSKIVESIAFEIKKTVEKNIKEEFEKEIYTLKQENRSIIKNNIIQNYILLLNIDKNNEEFFREYINSIFDKANIYEDKDINEDFYEETIRIAIKNLISLFENIKKSLEKNNLKENYSNNNLLTVFDIVKINSIGLNSKDKTVRDKYLSLYSK